MRPVFSSLGFDDLGEVFDDVGQAVAGENFLPEVIGLEAIGVGWIAPAVIPALVEWQEPGILAPEVGAEPHLLVVHGEMGQAAPELEELLPGIAVALVLLHGVVNRLLGQAVLQLKGGDGQAVDEQAQVQGQLRVVRTVPELAGDAEAVLPVEDLGLHVARRGRPVEQVNRVRPVLDAFAQHVNGSALGGFALQPGQEAAPGRAVLTQAQRRRNVGLPGASVSSSLTVTFTVTLSVLPFPSLAFTLKVRLAASS